MAGAERIIVLLLALAFWAGCCGASAQPLTIDGHQEMIPLTGHMEALEDADGSLAIEDMGRPDISARFQPLSGDLVAGYTRSTYWLRVQVLILPELSRHLFLEVGMPYLDSVGLFIPDGTGGFSAVRTGDRTPFSTRPIPHRDFVFNVAPQRGTAQTIYLRVQSTSQMTVVAQLWTEDGFIQMATRDSLLLGLLNGAILAIVLFALFQYVLSRDRLYLYFTVYAMGVEFAHLAMNGLLSQYAFPKAPYLADASVGLMVCLSTGMGYIFCTEMLDLRQIMPRLHTFLRAVGVLFILSGVSVLLDLYSMVAPVINAIVLVTLPPTVVLSLYLTLKGHRAALYFLISFASYFAAISLLTLRSLGLTDHSVISNMTAQAAALPHMLVLVVGLLHRSAGIDAYRLETIRRNERELERRVAERTAELAESNSALAAEVAERRAAEERQRESEQHVRAILDAAPFPMLVLGYPDGRFMFLNQPASELIDMSPSTLSDKTSRDFYVRPEERTALMRNLRDQGCVLGAELQIRRGPDDTRWTLLSAVRFSYMNREAVMVCLNDISTRKRLEESLRLAGLRSEAALEASNQAMREQRNFLSMISHEFRVPLAIIEASSQLLSIYNEPESEAQEEVAKIGRAVRRMSDLIDVCLADDRLDSNIVSLRIVRFDLGQMAMELCDDKRPFAGSRRIELKIETPTILRADATLLRIVLSNLVDNALKFSPPDTTVDVRILADGEGAMVSISDHGPGIALEEQPRIFEKFYRSTRADRVRGAGLGLYIVKRIVDLHGGSIAVDSLPGRGATFVLWLPLTPVAEKIPPA